MTLQMALFQFFLWLSNIPLYIQATSSSLSSGYIDYFYVLATINGGAMLL